MSAQEAREIGPVFWAYGQAVFRAQELESTLRLLFSIINMEREQQGFKKVDLELDNPKAHYTVGKLFKELLGVEYVTNKEQSIIWKAIRQRNILVHSYWNEERTLAMMTPNGREWLVEDADKKRKMCNKANRILTSLIDDYIKKYGTSIKELGAAMWEELYENDTEPPPHTLQ